MLASVPIGGINLAEFPLVEVFKRLTSGFGHFSFLEESFTADHYCTHWLQMTRITMPTQYMLKASVIHAHSRD